MLDVNRTGRQWETALPAMEGERQRSELREERSSEGDSQKEVGKDESCASLVAAILAHALGPPELHTVYMLLHLDLESHGTN